MVDLSVTGIARKYRGRTGNLSIVRDVLGLSSIEGSVSLRSTLESMARHEEAGRQGQTCKIDFGEGEVDYPKWIWDVAFEQTWTHIRVRLQADAKMDPSDTSNLTTLENTWESAIRNTWNNRWGCERPGESTCRLTFEIKFVAGSESPHHILTILSGSADFRENMTKWSTSTDAGYVINGPSAAAHEFGHMIGNKDEYQPDDPTECVGRDPVNTGTVMDRNEPNIPARLVAHLANNIGSNIVRIT